MYISNKFKFTVVIMATIINLGWALPAEAQDDERPPTRSTAPVSTPVTSDGPTVNECLPLAGQICTPPQREERIIRRTVPKPRACIWGHIVGADHTTIQAGNMTVAGHVMSPGQGLPSTIDIGIGGDCICNDGGSEHDSYYLPADADHTPINGVRSVYEGRLATDGHEICLPRRGANSENQEDEDVSVDLRPIIVWLEGLNGSICELRATDLCQSAVNNLNACEDTARMARDRAAYEACFEQHAYTGWVTLSATDIVTGDLEQNCAGVSFECSQYDVDYAPEPWLPADMVGEGSSVGEFLSQNVDFQVDVNLCAGQSGLESSLVCGEIGGQVNLRPFASNRLGILLRGSYGGGNIGDEDLAIQDYVPVDRFTRGSVSLGLQITLVPRLRLDILAGFVRYTTGNSAENGSGDGARGNGLRTELAFTVDLTRPRAGFRAVPYFRIGVDVQHVTWDIFTTSGGHNYVNRTGVAGMIGFGLRLGSGAILAH